MMSNVIKSPSPIKTESNFKKIFLAGTIGINAEFEDWQSKVCEKLNDYALTIYNPRRDSWDGTWEQSIKNTKLAEQINWEIDGLDASDFIIMNILGNSQSPISLLEFGRYSESNKMIVCCPKEFYRYGNIEVMCFRYNIPLFDNIDDLLNYFIKERL